MRFSVVIPTRNRSALLVHAMRSALEQRHDDFEIVVSNNASWDATESVARGFVDSRIRYLATGKALSMADHWDFVLEQVKGEWVVVLCDDDALIPDALSYLEGLIREHAGIRLIQYGQLTYVYDDGIESRGNYLRYRRPIPSRTRLLSSRSHLEEAFSTISWNMPKFLNSAVRMDLAGEIRQRHGRLFHKWAPDYASAILLLAHAGRFLVTERPAMVWGKNVQSYGSGSQADPAHLRSFLAENEEFPGRFPHSPYPDLICVHNVLCDTLYRMRDRLPELRDRLAIDPRALRRLLKEDLRLYLSRGFAEYQPWLDRIEADSRAASDERWERLERFKETGRRKLRKWRDRLTGSRTRITKVYGGGEQAPFTNIFEAAVYFWRTEAAAAR